MPIDPRIALGVQPLQLPQQDPNQGLNALARMMQLRGMQDEQQVNSLNMQKLQRGVDEENRLNSIYGGAVGPDGTIDRNKLFGGLASGNLGSKIPGIQKQLLEADTAGATLKKTQAETTKAELETALKKTQHAASVLSLAKDPQSYATVRAVVKAQFGQDLPEQFDPATVQAMIAQGQTLTERLAAEHQRLTLVETGRHNVVTEGETGRHNKASEGIQFGQLKETSRHNTTMEGYRGTEVSAASMSQPFAVTGPDGKEVLVQQDKRTGKLSPVQGGYGPKTSDKAMTEGQAKANLFGTRMQEADKVLGQMAASGVKRPGSIKGVAESVGNIAGLGTESLGGALSDAAGSLTNWTQSPEQRQVEQAQRDFINAALRRESGASISPAEFRNANKQYFPQPNDDDDTLALKARNRQIATQGILAEVPESQRMKVPPPTGPQPGAVQDGYRFKGGNPADKSNWEKV